MMITDRSKSTYFTTEMLRRLAPSIGAAVVTPASNDYIGRIEFANGKTSYFRESIFDVNPAGAVEIAIDKYGTHFFLRRGGCQTPDSILMTTTGSWAVRRPPELQPGIAFAEEHGWPVVVKPNTFSQGTLVTVVHTAEDFELAAGEIFRFTDSMIVETFCQGDPVRMVVFDGGIVAAYRRHPLSVVGDGARTIGELLVARQLGEASLNLGGPEDPLDFRIPMKLARSGLTLDSVPDENDRIPLLDCASLTPGRDGDDLTHQLHPYFRQLAIDVAANLGLTLCGIDIIATDLTRKSDYAVIEVNSAPGLGSFAAFGEAQALVVKGFYLGLLHWLELR